MTDTTSHALRILMVAHAFPPTFGGVETHLWDISHELAARGHQVHCLVGGETSSEEFGPVTVSRHPELTVKHLTGMRLDLEEHEINNTLRASLRRVVAETLASHPADLIHVHNAHHFAPELALACFDSGAGRPLLNSVHDRVGEHLFPAVLKYQWAHTIFASHYLRKSLSSGTGPETALWLGIDLNAYSPHGELDERLERLERPVIFHPARLLRWKGVTVGLDAFIVLREWISKGSLILCESSNIVDDQGEVKALRGDLEETARRHGVQERVHFLQFQRGQMASAYRACDLVWYPTIDEEPLGLVPLEAMACGAPLIVTDSGGMRETVIQRETGIIVPKNDPLALAEAAREIVSDAELRDRLVAAGRRRAASFDVKNYTTTLEKIYDMVSEANYGNDRDDA